MRAMTAAAKALNRSLGPSTWPMGTPRMGARRSDAVADRPAAITHTIVPIRLIGMPSWSERSDDSAAARMATPKRLKRKKAERAIAMTITETMASTWPAWKIWPPSLKLIVKGGTKS